MVSSCISMIGTISAPAKGGKNEITMKSLTRKNQPGSQSLGNPRPTGANVVAGVECFVT